MPACPPAKARKRALDVLYEADLRAERPLEVLRRLRGADRAAAPGAPGYTVALVEGVAAAADRIDELIASYAEGWTLEPDAGGGPQPARIAVYELLYVDEIDDAVAISEAVELATADVHRRVAAVPQRHARPDRRVRHSAPERRASQHHGMASQQRDGAHQ